MTLGYLKTEKYIDEGKRLGVYNPNNKLCVLIATAPSWLRDFNKFNNSFPDIEYDIFAINKTISRIENVKHFCTLHPRCHVDGGSQSWQQMRLDKGWGNNYKTHTPSVPANKFPKGNEFHHWKQFVDYTWNVSIRKGSSGLFGVGVAMGMGYKGVLVCGVELERRYRRYLANWRNFSRAFRYFARAQSGVLRVSLGHPTSEWIERVTK